MLLALETSCDETAAAVLAGAGDLRASVTASQASEHAVTGGVVPEVASRRHLQTIRSVAAGALARAGIPVEALHAVAATAGPGLASALLVGFSFGKALAVSLDRPFVAVNHIEGHLLSPFFGREEIPPAVGLVVSGGHTLLVAVDGPSRYRLLGRTLDDAAGEAFDKVAKLLGLPYPGGPEVERAARQGDPQRFLLPRAMKCSGDANFSFSGLKTAVRTLLPRLAPGDVPDVCAGFQEAVVDVLVHKAVRTTLAERRRVLAVSGGVSLNGRLREQLLAAASAAGLEVLFAAPELCTDNAAMIAYAAHHRLSDPASVAGLQADIAPSLGAELFAG